MGMDARAAIASSVVVMAILACEPPLVCAQPRHQSNPRDTARSPLSTDSAALSLSLGRLSARSAAWREAVEQVAETGRRVFIVTPSRVRVIDPRDGSEGPFDAGVLAEVRPIPDERFRVDAVVVVVNVPLLERIHRFQGRMMDFEDDLDSVLAHEIYGHAIPYLLAGDMSGRCPDPSPGQPAFEACAIQRENVVRAQLGLSPRHDYGLDALAIAGVAHRSHLRP